MSDFTEWRDLKERKERLSKERQEVRAWLRGMRPHFTEEAGSYIASQHKLGGKMVEFARGAKGTYITGPCLAKQALEDDRRERQRLKKTLEASNRWDDCDDDWGNIGFYRNDYD